MRGDPGNKAILVAHVKDCLLNAAVVMSPFTNWKLFLISIISLEVKVTRVVFDLICVDSGLVYLYS